ncbi:MAG: hypothetical protein B9S32_11325 [Verrucomicrobia bacterium Tous-C9LFEB]|nr:MAG: hypothetical protein B9S32_11325 [Verrucomicrobia bacterium Tous-C9LFEB]
MKPLRTPLPLGVSQHESTRLEKECRGAQRSAATGRDCHTPDVAAEFLRDIGTLNRHFAKVVGQISWSPSHSQFRSNL